MKTKLFFVAISLLSATIQAQTIEEGLKFYNEERFDQAKQSLINLNKKGENEQADYLLGEIYFQNGQLDSASICYQQGINKNPKYLYNYTGLGKVSLQKGDIADAKANFEKVKKGAKSDLKLLLSVADATLNANKKDTTIASEYIHIAQDKDSKSPYLHIALGDLNLQRRDIGRALSDYNNALYYGADAQVVGFKLASIYSRTNNIKDAEKSYKDIITAKPNAALPYKKMGDMFFSFGKYAEAKSAYDSYFSKTTPTSDEKEKYALIQFFNKNYDATEALLKEITVQNQDNPVLFRVRAYSAYERGDYNNGLMFMNKFFSIQKPEKTICLDYEYYAKLLSKNDQDSLAAINFLKAYDFDSTKFQNLEEAGKIFSKLKKHDKAIFCYTQMSNNPQQDKSALAYMIGKEYYFNGAESLTQTNNQSTLNEKSIVSLNKADSCFQQVITLSPKFSGAYLWKARTLSLLDPDAKSDKAKIAYENLLSVTQASQKPDNSNIIECYRYLASYNYLQFEKGNKNLNLKKEYKKASIDYFEKILVISPSDKQASDSLILLKKAD